MVTSPNHMTDVLEIRRSRSVSISDHASALQSPYARMALRRNPFGELTRDERAMLAVVDVAPWIELLKSAATVLQFIGEKGHGKTTHLLAIHRAIPDASYVYLPEEGPPPSIPSTRPLLVDEAQRLGRFVRWRVFRRGGPLVLGTHRDFTAELRKAGLQVVTVDVEAQQSPERLAQILNQRITASCLANAEVPRITIDQAKELQRRFGGDIRAVESHLYDLFQSAAQKEITWPLAI